MKFLDEHAEIDIVGGPQINSPDDKFFARAGGAAMTSFFGTFTMSSRYKKTKPNLDADEFSLTTANVFIRKKIFEKISPFNTNIYPGEDPELFSRAKITGLKLAFLPDIAVQHGRRATLKAFCKQFFIYGRTRVIKEQMVPTSFPKNMLFALPSMFLVGLLALSPLSWFSNYFLLPFGLYALTAVAFSFEAAVYSRIPLALPILPFLFLFIHISYGAGYLVGLTKKKQKFDAHDVIKGDK